MGERGDFPSNEAFDTSQGTFNASQGSMDDANAEEVKPRGLAAMRGNLSHRRRASSFGNLVHISSKWSFLRYRIALILTTASFEAFMSITIIFNMFLVIHSANAQAKYGEIPLWLEALSHLLLGVYTIELSLKLYAFQWDFFKHASNIMDICVIVTDITMIILSQIVGALPSATALRILRLLRLLRAGRILQYIPELYIMVSGMVSTVRAMACATFLILVTLALWSIIAVEFLNPLALTMSERGMFDTRGGTCERCGRSFASVQESMLTFFQSVVAGDSWGEVALPMIEEQPACVFIFVPVMITVNLGLLNLLLTAIVNQAHLSREQDAQHKLHEKQREYFQIKQKLLKLCDELDNDQNGALSFDEILTGYDENENFQDLLRLMDIRRSDLSMVFKFLDDDDSGEVSFVEFVEQLYLLKAKSTHTLLVFIKTHIFELKKVVSKMSEAINGRREAAAGDEDEECPPPFDKLEAPEVPSVSAAPLKEEKAVAVLESRSSLAPIGVVSDLTHTGNELNQLRQTMHVEMSMVLEDIAGKSQALLQFLHDGPRLSASEPEERKLAIPGVGTDCAGQKQEQMNPWLKQGSPQERGNPWYSSRGLAHTLSPLPQSCMADAPTVVAHKPLPATAGISTDR